MDEPERKELAYYWIEKSRNSLARAEADVADGSYSFAVSRLYYAAFYAVSAALASEGKAYGKHSAVRSMFNRYYVKEGVVDRELGDLYNVLYDERNEGDYKPFVTFGLDDVEPKLEKMSAFIQEFSRIVDKNLS